MTLNRNAVPVLAIFAAAGLMMSACEKETTPPAGEKTVNQQVGDASRAATDAAMDGKSAALTAKDNFVQGATQQLNALEKSVNDFVASSREKMPNATAEVNRVRDELNSAIAKAKTQLDKARNATAEGWKDASASFQQAFAEAQRSFNQVKDQFTGAPTPSVPPAHNSPENPGR